MSMVTGQRHCVALTKSEGSVYEKAYKGEE